MDVGSGRSASFTRVFVVCVCDVRCHAVFFLFLYFVFVVVGGVRVVFVLCSVCVLCLFW